MVLGEVMVLGGVVYNSKFVVTSTNAGYETTNL